VNTPPSQKAQAEGQAADLSRWARRKPAGLPGEAGRSTRQQKLKRAIDAYVVRVREGTGTKAIIKHH